MLIQFPILMAMYRVIQYIPMYVGQLKNLFVNILTGTDGGIMNVSGYADIMAENFKMTGRMTNVDWGNIDSAVTAMRTARWLSSSGCGGAPGCGRPGR